MTSKKDKSPGPDDAAVGLKYEEPRPAGGDEPLRKQGPELVADERTTSGSVSGEHAPDPEREDAQAVGRAEAEAGAGTVDGGDPVKRAEFQEVSNSRDGEKTANLNLLLDVVVPVSVELGRTSLTVKDILSTYQGSVIELDRAAGEPVDIMVGGKPLARGEVVVVKDRFGVRVTELIGSIEGVEKA